MTIGHDGRGRDHGGGGAARGPRRRRLGAVAAGAVFALAAIASAGERYATSGDPSILDLEGAWRAMILPPVVDLCTGNVTFRRTEETRDPETSAPGLDVWRPLDRYPTGQGTERATDAEGTTLTHDGGGDLDTFGIDGYFMYRFAARGASCFLRIVLEAEDGAYETWRIRYHGTESATVTNGPAVRATELTFRDDYFVTWNRDIVNTDGVEGDFFEDKTIEQDFAVRLRLVDGREVHEGARFALTSPSSAKTSRVLGPKLDVKVDDKGLGVGAGLGFSWGEEMTYETFSTLPRAEREHAVTGSTTVTRALPCPDTTVADVHTWFDGDFSVRDHEWFSGSDGARQELTLAVVHQLSEVRASGCLACVKPPPPTTPPPTTPPTVPPTAPPGTQPLPPKAPPVTTPDDPPVGGAPSPTPVPTTPSPSTPVPTTPSPTLPVPAQPLPATPSPTGPVVPLGPLLPPDGGAPFVPLGGPAPADGPLVPRAADGAGPGGCPLPESSPWPAPVGRPMGGATVSRRTAGAATSGSRPSPTARPPVGTDARPPGRPWRGVGDDAPPRDRRAAGTQAPGGGSGGSGPQRRATARVPGMRRRAEHRPRSSCRARAWRRGGAMHVTWTGFERGTSEGGIHGRTASGTVGAWGIRGLGAVAVAAALFVGLSRAADGPSDDGVPIEPVGHAGDGDGAGAAPPTLRAGGAGGPSADDAHVEHEGRVRLGARWRVHVVDARDGRDLAGAEVDAEVELVAHPRPGGRHAVAASRTTTTGPDGRATLERMPSGRGGAVFVRARGYVLGRAAVEASDAPTRDVEVRMIARLPLPLASAPVDVFADGRPLAPEDATLVVAFDDGAPREARPGERVVVDDDPAGAPTREATVRLLVPGYAGPPQRLSLTRGVRARLETSLPPPREVVVAVLDPTGAPLAGVDVRIAPASVLGAVEARTTWHGVTDASGEVRASAPFASALAVRPRAAGRYFPVADRIVDVDGPSTRVEAVGLPLARLTVALADGAAPSELALAWSDVAFAPAVEAAVADGLAGGARATARGALARTLPARVAVDDAAARPVRATLEVLPGTFTLVASAAGATSAPTSCTVPPEGAEVEVRLATLVTVPFTLVGDGPASPSPFAAGVWIGHRAGLAERLAVERVFDRLWRAPPGPARDAWVAAAVAGAAGGAGGLPADLAVVGPTGRVEARPTACRTKPR